MLTENLENKSAILRYTRNNRNLPLRGVTCVKQPFFALPLGDPLRQVCTAYTKCTLMCLYTGISLTINCPFETNDKLMVLCILIYKHIRVSFIHVFSVLPPALIKALVQTSHLLSLRYSGTVAELAWKPSFS